MTLDDVLTSLFPSGHQVERGPFNTLQGMGRCDAEGDIALIGAVDGAPVGVEAALTLAGHVLAVIRKEGATPILVLIDASIQSMTRREELLGLNEYFGHLIKVFALAALRGHRTIALLYGPAAGGAFIATALATKVLVTVPGAEPSVMDLPSIARVTKLPLEKLREMAKSTPIFAPGVEPLFLTGAVTETWTGGQPFAPRLVALLRRPVSTSDLRDHLGLERKGRLLARKIAERVAAGAAAHA